MEPQKHSGMGIASFIISVGTGVLTLILLVIAGLMEASTPGGIDENSVAAVAVGLFLIAMMAGMLVAIGLGIAGLFQKDRKKVFAILGIVFATAAFLCTTLLMLVGMSME